MGRRERDGGKRDGEGKREGGREDGWEERERKRVKGTDCRPAVGLKDPLQTVGGGWSGSWPLPTQHSSWI